MNMKLKWDFQNLNSLLPFNEKSCQMNLFLDTIFFGWLADSQQNLLGTEKAINSTIFWSHGKFRRTLHVFSAYFLKLSVALLLYEKNNYLHCALFKKRIIYAPSGPSLGFYTNFFRFGTIVQYSMFFTHLFKNTKRARSFAWVNIALLTFLCYESQ